MTKLGMNLARTGWQTFGRTALGLASVASAACGGGSGNDAGAGGVDAFVASGEDASGGFACPIPASSGGCVVTTTGEMGMTPADFSCLGTRRAPEPGAAAMVNFRLSVFGSDGQVARNTRVQLFADNQIRDTCEAPLCQEFTTSMADGTATGITVNGRGWYAYRVFQNSSGSTAATRYTDSVQYNENPPAAGGEIVGNAVAFSTLDLIPLSLGLEREPGTTILAGRVQDCEGSDVGGAFVRAFLADGTEVLDAGEASSIGPHYRYFRRIGEDSNPSNEQPYTNFEGLYAALNIPVSEDLVRVETWGRREGDASPVLLGCEAVRTLANGVTIINVQPLRSDYASGHPCARYTSTD
ncbi:MAG: hypothetical protein ACK5U8_14725 [Deltaproteobacteria bacterium]